MELGYRQKIENMLFRVERVFNGLGYVPFVSSFSGPLRVTMGKAEMVAGAIFALVDYCLHAEEGTVDLSFIVHGAANCLLGMAETIFVVGNLCTFTYGYIFGFHFSYEMTQLKRSFSSS